jgi:hypothetical protein
MCYVKDVLRGKRGKYDGKDMARMLECLTDVKGCVYG